MSDSIRQANVKIQGRTIAVTVPVTSNKPHIRNDIKSKWQNLINVMAECLDVPSGLIMEIHASKISVFLSSHSAGNPYKEGESEKLLMGLYCETVIGTGENLRIPDATKLEEWKNNPDIKLGMISYLGFPIKWPDGEFFGTLCILDSKENPYSDKHVHLMDILKSVIEEDLQNLIENHVQVLGYFHQLEQINVKLKDMVKEREILLSEVHHRVKNNMQIITNLIELQDSERLSGERRLQTLSIKNRIQAMSIVHEILYKSEDLKDIKLEEYIHKLVDNLIAGLAAPDLKLNVEYDIDEEFNISFENAIPIGLITNEIITNSIKYAFTTSANAEIIIRIRDIDEKSYSFTISDNGCGIEDAGNSNRETGMGRVLIPLLVQQMRGTLSVSSSHGTEYSMILSRTPEAE